ncbi:MAG: V-type ATPase subunit [Burkholderiales bacterium]|nr:V-type ATPase subunit [Burkholderiales bacterium]
MLGDAYLDTRVSLFAQGLWSDDELTALVRRSPAEVSQALNARGLTELAAGYSIHSSLEARIIARLLQESRILVRPLQGEERQFLLYWIRRFEVSNVKTLIRARLSGERQAELAPKLIDMGPFARLDLTALTQTEDVRSLMRALEAGPYAEIVRHARRAFEDSQDPFILDATLDRAYLEGLVRHARAVEGGPGAALHGLMSRLIDRINLVWLLRYRFNYDLPPPRVYYLLVGAHYQLGADLLRRLVTLPDLAAVLAALPTVYARLLAGADDVFAVTCRLENAAAVHARRVLRSDAPPLARAFAYLLLRERGLRGLRAVLRGHHLGLPEDLIGRALGHLH